MPKLDMEAIKVRDAAVHSQSEDEEVNILLSDRHELIVRVEELEAAIQAKCAYCRESWDAGLDDPDFCPTNCPLLPYVGLSSTTRP